MATILSSQEFTSGPDAGNNKPHLLQLGTHILNVMSTAGLELFHSSKDGTYAQKEGGTLRIGVRNLHQDVEAIIDTDTEDILFNAGDEKLVPYDIIQSEGSDQMSLLIGVIEKVENYATALQTEINKTREETSNNIQETLGEAA